MVKVVAVLVFLDLVEEEGLKEGTADEKLIFCTNLACASNWGNNMNGVYDRHAG
jgi:hypothetical protein